MNDKYYMENLLNSAKSMCNLLLNGTVESGTPYVNSAMNQALFDCLSLQNAIYKKMESYGWYKNTPVSKSKIVEASSTIANS